jgi:preprotein translocase subunit YajC
MTPLNIGSALLAQQQAQPPGWWNLLPFVLIFVVFYFLLIAPQRKRQKQLEGMLKNLKSGDKITTSSGIIGVIVSIKDKTVSIRSADTKLEVLKSAISEVTERAGDTGQAQA